MPTREPTQRTMEILLVEDNPGDVHLAREGLADLAIPYRLSVVEDGEEALTFLRQQGRFAAAARPHLIVLDLNLPRIDGRKVLADIKTDDSLKRIPVVILTTSQAEEDVLNCYNRHANCYITKPRRIDQYIEMIKTIEAFWFTTVSLPPGGPYDD